MSDTTFTWTVSEMFTVDTPDPGFVVNVSWALTGVNGDATASIPGSSTFTQQSGTFIPYDQLTPEIVIGWVQASLGESGVANYEACVQGVIDGILNPHPAPQNTPLPWAEQPGS